MKQTPPSHQPPLEVVEPYSRLAPVYDSVMDHVDYEAWATYIMSLLSRYKPNTQSVLELGCGTGSFARVFNDLFDVQYLATDGAQTMVDLAKKKLSDGDIEVAVADFSNFAFNRSFDLILLLYDCINYLLEEEHIASFLSSSYNALAPGGLLIFDQSTPANSLNNEGDFDYEGHAGTLRYRRESSFNPISRLHVTDLTIFKSGHRYVERHVQKAYSQHEIERSLRSTQFEILAAYEDFSFLPGKTTSERLHWVVRKNEKT